MPIKALCTKCGLPIMVKDELAGSVVACPACKTMFGVPRPAGAPPSGVKFSPRPAPSSQQTRPSPSTGRKTGLRSTSSREPREETIAAPPPKSKMVWILSGVAAVVAVAVVLLVTLTGSKEKQGKASGGRKPVGGTLPDR